jgi:hypothetical protein
MAKRRKPMVLLKCVANTYTSPDERIVEVVGLNGMGFLMSMRQMDGRMHVSLYRIDEGITVQVDDRREPR